MNYYLVKAKCGHVGNGKYIVKTFPVIAKSKSDAASVVKKYRKVKKHLKDLIISVEKVTLNTYLLQKEANYDDIYLHSHTKDEIYEILLSDQVCYLDMEEKEYKSKREFETRKERVSYKLKRNLYKEDYVYECTY